MVSMVVFPGNTSIDECCPRARGPARSRLPESARAVLSTTRVGLRSVMSGGLRSSRSWPWCAWGCGRLSTKARSLTTLPPRTRAPRSVRPSTWDCSCPELSGVSGGDRPCDLAGGGRRTRASVALGLASALQWSTMFLVAPWRSAGLAWVACCGHGAAGGFTRRRAASAALMRHRGSSRACRRWPIGRAPSQW